jgi:2'-5' RNA ligase
MRSIYTISYPEFAEESARFIEGFRHEHDLPYREVVAAHFTLVFSSKGVCDAEYMNHVREVALSSKPIDFVCRYAMLGSDHLDESAYVFLVPDEGYSGISLLHDKLYRGVLSSALRLEVQYVPHITIGTLRNREEARALCDGLNRAGLSLVGRLSVLTVGALNGGKFENLASFELKG